MDSNLVMAAAASIVLIVIPVVMYICSGIRSTRRLPPSPPSLPIIGHLHLLSDMPHHAFAALAQSLGPIFYLRLGRVPAVVISSPQLAKVALTTLDPVLASRPDLLSSRILSFGSSDITFSPSGPYHRQSRRIAVTELLSSRRIAAAKPIRQEEISRLLSHVAADVSADAETDMSLRFLTLATDVLCRAAFGRRFEAGEKLSEVLVETQALFAGFSVGEFFPELEGVISRVTGLRRRLENCLAELRKVCDEVAREHCEKASSNGGATEEDEGSARDVEDFVDVLLRVQKSDDLDVPITDDNLKALVLDMYVAGTDTTSATLEWAMTELARHPQVMSTAQDEVRGVVGRHGAVVEEHHVQQLRYLRAVIKETFRLHPPVPLLVPRESLSECTIAGYVVPAKTRVFINSFALGRDPSVWTDPLEFNPGRFAGSEAIDLKGKDFELLPFGGGRRGCPGYSFALATIESTLASLLYHFDWELPAGITPKDVDISEVFGLATRKKEPLILVARKGAGGEIVAGRS